jgi:glycosyltransferase involved in cell wall biosynthesis
MPSYNEGSHLYDNLARTSERLRAWVPELIVVDDGSADDTYAEAARAQKDGLPVAIVRHPDNRGKGAALRQGAERASADVVAFLDADLEIKPDYLIDFMQELARTGADVVVGCRDQAPSSFPVVRRMMSTGYRWLIQLLFGLKLRETQAGIKLFRREVLQVCLPHTRATRFAFDVELLALCERFGYRIVERPVSPEFRRSGQMARMTFGAVAGTFVETLVVWLRSSSLVWLDPGEGPRGWMATLAAALILTGAGAGLLIDRLLNMGNRGAPLWPAALVVGGGILAGLALVQLNKTLVRAFARAERLGVWRRPPARPRGPS